MATDLSGLREENFPPNFTVDSERLGQLGFRKLYGLDYPYLAARPGGGSEEDFVGKFMVALGWRMDDRDRLCDADRRALSPSDMQAFSEAFVQHEPTVFEGNPRRDGEDWLAYLRRGGAEAVKQRKGPFKSSAVLDMQESLQRNIEAAANMRSLLAEPPPQFEMPPIPRNPIVDTNSTLGRVEKQISRMADFGKASAELQTSLNDYARSAITEMKAGADLTERNAKLALRVGLAGVAIGVVSALVSALTWAWTADQQNRADKTRAAEASALAHERQADRDLMRRQLDAMTRNADLLEKRLPSTTKANAAERRAAMRR